MAIFLSFLKGNIGQEIGFHNIIERETAFIEKQQVQKVEKNSTFPKGLVHGFGQKLAIFRSFFF